jgi:hypothetical protein
MLDSETVDALTREAKPRDFQMLRSYVRRSPTREYVRGVMIPSLRIRHPRIWTHIDSRQLGA